LARIALPALSRLRLTDLVALVLAVALALSALTLVIAAWGFTTDDAYIPLRYARHLVAGDGLRWNPRETPVEGYSNFTYVLAGAAALVAGSDPVVTLKTAGALSLLGVLFVLPALQREGARLALGLTAAFLWLSYPWVAIWSVSGLETSTYALLALAAVALAARGAEQLERGATRAARLALGAAGIAVLLAALTRPEGPLVGISLAAGAVAHGATRDAAASADRRRGPFARGVAVAGPVAVAAALPYGLYLGWKLAWFGDLLPNSVRCKAFYAGDPWSLLGQAAPLVGWTLPLAAWAVVRRPDLPRVSLAVFAALSLVILYGVDPIVGYGNRHVLAAYAALVSLAVTGASDLAAKLFPALGARRAAVTLLALAAAWCLVVLAPRARFARNAAAAYASRDAARRELARWLDTRHPAHARVVLGDCGLVGYFTRARIVDAFCLNSREIPRDPIRRDPSRFASWVFEAPPEAIVLASTRGDRLAFWSDAPNYAALARHPAFAGYRPAAIFGHESDTLFYWVFERAAGDARRFDPPETKPASSLRVAPVSARSAPRAGSIHAAAVVSAISAGTQSAR
jgi:hypothetical protein